ncbi:MAG: IS630 family transposase [bacterium]|nr:IS630 family transposase [bacterium]
MRYEKAAEIFDVHAGSIYKWVKKEREQGSKALLAKKQGRPNKGGKLEGWQAGIIVRALIGKHPNQMKLPFALWTREAVGELIKANYGIELSRWTVGRLLRKWGFTPQKPIKRAYERNPEVVEHWVKYTYKEIKKQAQKNNGEILWGDEMGVRSDHQAGRSYGKKGKTPVVMGSGKQFRCNMISAISNTGVLRFSLFTGKFDTEKFIEFLRRLIKTVVKKVYLIIDGHPVHRSGRVKAWLEKNKHLIEIFFLPPYSPDLNPDELLNNDVKSNLVGSRRPKTLSELTHLMRSFLIRKQKNPKSVSAYFPKNKFAFIYQ